MNKEKLKTQTTYNINFKVAEDDFESLEIIQEENVPHRKAIQVKFFGERWREPKDVVELLKKIIIVVEKNFIEK